MANEPIPIDDVFTELDNQWNASNVTKPSFIKVNAANQPIRFDLNVGDQVTIRPRAKGLFTFKEEFTNHLLIDGDLFQYFSENMNLL